MTLFQFKKKYLVLIFLGLILPYLASSNSDSDLAKEVVVKFKGDNEPYKFKVSSKSDLARIIKEYLANPQVEFAEPNITYQAATFIPNDPDYIKQNYLQNIKAPDAWDQSQGEGTIIAFLDSGIQLDHPDLRENIWINRGEIPNDSLDNDNDGYIDDVSGWDFILNRPDSNPQFSPGCTVNKSCSEIGVNHGTIVAGVAAGRGQNQKGIIGVAWKSQIMSLRVLNSLGIGDTVTVTKGINYAISKDVDVINLSFVGVGKSQVLEDALKRAYDQGIVIVAAAGNDSTTQHGFNMDETPMYPVCDPEEENIVLGVGTITSDGKKALFSNYGAKCLDLATYGSQFYSTEVYRLDVAYPQEFGRFYGGWWSGTSLSAPLVSGVAALIKSKNKGLSAKEVISLILDKTSDYNNLEESYKDKFGKGLLNAYQAVGAASNQPEPISQAAENYLLVGPNSGYNAEVKLYKFDNIYNQSYIKRIIAYDEKYVGGLNAVGADVNQDRSAEIIIAPTKGNRPLIQIFDQFGRVRYQFFAYDKNFRGGVSLAAADVDGDGQTEIITGAGPGGGPHVRIFDQFGRVRYQFFAYDKNFRGGVSLASCNLFGDFAQIIAAPKSQISPAAKVFSSQGEVLGQFLTFEKIGLSGATLGCLKIQ